MDPFDRAELEALALVRAEATGAHACDGDDFRDGVHAALGRLRSGGQMTAVLARDLLVMNLVAMVSGAVHDTAERQDRTVADVLDEGFMTLLGRQEQRQRRCDG